MVTDSFNCSYSVEYIFLARPESCDLKYMDPTNVFFWLLSRNGTRHSYFHMVWARVHIYTFPFRVQFATPSSLIIESESSWTVRTFYKTLYGSTILMTLWIRLDKQDVPIWWKPRHMLQRLDNVSYYDKESHHVSEDWRPVVWGILGYTHQNNEVATTFLISQN